MGASNLGSDFYERTNAVMRRLRPKMYVRLAISLAKCNFTTPPDADGFGRHINATSINRLMRSKELDEAEAILSSGRDWAARLQEQFAFNLWRLQIFHCQRMITAHSRACLLGSRSGISLVDSWMLLKQS